MTEIEKALRGANPSLYADFTKSRETAERLLERVYINFPSYTDHGAGHAARVLKQIDKMLPSKVLSQLSPQELLILLLGGLWHDVGMVGERSENSPEDLRDSHQEIGAHRVLEAPGDYDIPRTFGPAVAEVIRHHRASDINDEVEMASVDDELVNFPLICGLVRTGDELDLKDRGPQVVADVMQLPQESLVHFELSSCITGVSPDCAVGEIVISATAPTVDIEDAIKDLCGKIDGQLEALDEVFQNADIPKYRTRLVLTRDNIILDKVKLALCARAQSITQLSEMIEEESRQVKRKLQWLHYRKMAAPIETGDEQSEWHLIEDHTVFERLFTEYVGSSREAQFMASTYAQQMIGGPVFDHLVRVFRAHYDDRSEEMRRDVLRNSPTALRIALLVADVPIATTPIAQTVFLDSALLLGWIRDTCRPGHLKEGLDVPLITRSIARDIKSNAPNFTRLMSRALDYRKMSNKELIQDVIASAEDLPGRQEELSLHITTTAAEQDGLTPLHLMAAAMYEGVPFEITSGDDTQISVDYVRGNERDTESPEWLRITPRPRRHVPELPPPHIAGSADWDSERCALVITLDLGRTYDQKMFPLRFNITPMANDRINLQLVKHHDPSMTVGELLELKKVFSNLASSEKALIEGRRPGSEETIFEATVSGKDAQRLASVFEMPDDMEMLSATERVEAEEVVLPLCYRQAFSDFMEFIGDGISEMDMGSSTEEKQRDKPPVTMLRTVVIDAKGRTLRNECPVVLPGLVDLSVRMIDCEKQAKANEALAERSKETKISYWRPETPAELLQLIIDAAEEFEIALPVGMEDTDPPYLTRVTCTFSPIIDTPWERIQELTVELRAPSEEWQRFGVATQHIEANDYATAEEELASLIVEFPLFVEAHLNLGIVLAELGELARAEHILDNALQVLEVGANSVTEDAPVAPERILRGAIKMHLMIVAALKEQEDLVIERLQAISADRLVDLCPQIIEALEEYVKADRISSELKNKIIEWLPEAGLTETD